MRSGWTRRSIPVWANAVLPAGMPVQGNLDPLALIAGGAALDDGDRPHPGGVRRSSAVFNLGHGILPDTPIAHVEQLIARVRDDGMMRVFSALAYDWVKAAHVIFVIFWMAGLFMLPRYLVYHQEALAAGRSDEAAMWVEREAQAPRASS